MPLWGAIPEPQDPPPLAYVCSVCHGPLDLRDVFRVDMHGFDGVRVTHYCPLDGHWHVTRYPHRRSALVNLFGEPPTLPWTALGNRPHLSGEVVEFVPGDPPSSVNRAARIDAEVNAFAEELEACDHAGHVLQRMRGPRSRDADIVREHRRRRGREESGGAGA